MDLDHGHPWFAFISSPLSGDSQKDGDKEHEEPGSQVAPVLQVGSRCTEGECLPTCFRQLLFLVFYFVIFLNLFLLKYS